MRSKTTDRAWRCPSHDGFWSVLNIALGPRSMQWRLHGLGMRLNRSFRLAEVPGRLHQFIYINEGGGRRATYLSFDPLKPGPKGGVTNSLHSLGFKRMVKPGWTRSYEKSFDGKPKPSKKWERILNGFDLPSLLKPTSGKGTQLQGVFRNLFHHGWQATFLDVRGPVERFTRFDCRWSLQTTLYWAIGERITVMPTLYADERLREKDIRRISPLCERELHNLGFQDPYGLEIAEKTGRVGWSGFRRRWVPPRLLTHALSRIEQFKTRG